MKTRFRTTPWLAALVLIAAGANARAQAPAAPSAEEILDRSVRTQYGETPEGLKSYRIEGTFAVPMQGLRARMTILAKAPNKLFTVVDIPGMGKMEEGYDGQTAWAKDAMSGLRAKEGAEATMARFGAEFYGDLHWRTRYSKVERKTEEVVDGRKAWVLVLHADGLSPMTQWVDAETNLPIRSQMEHDSPQGRFVVALKYMDHRAIEVPGAGTWRMPFKHEQTAAGMTQEIVVEKFEPNVELDDAVFAMPEPAAPEAPEPPK